jgi:hypothetical protein
VCIRAVSGKDFNVQAVFTGGTKHGDAFFGRLFAEE